MLAVKGQTEGAKTLQHKAKVSQHEPSGVPDGPIRCTRKHPVAAGAKAQNISCEKLDLPNLAGDSTCHVPLAQYIAAATAAQANGVRNIVHSCTAQFQTCVGTPCRVLCALRGCRFRAEKCVVQVRQACAGAMQNIDSSGPYIL